MQFTQVGEKFTNAWQTHVASAIRIETQTRGFIFVTENKGHYYMTTGQFRIIPCKKDGDMITCLVMPTFAEDATKTAFIEIHESKIKLRCVEVGSGEQRGSWNDVYKYAPLHFEQEGSDTISPVWLQNMHVIPPNRETICTQW